MFLFVNTIKKAVSFKKLIRSGESEVSSYFFIFRYLPLHLWLVSCFLKKRQRQTKWKNAIMKQETKEIEPKILRDRHMWCCSLAFGGFAPKPNVLFLEDSFLCQRLWLWHPWWHVGNRPSVCLTYYKNVDFLIADSVGGRNPWTFCLNDNRF
jgi:hypothetical protein